MRDGVRRRVCGIGDIKVSLFVRLFVILSSFHLQSLVQSSFLFLSFPFGCRFMFERKIDWEVAWIDRESPSSSLPEVMHCFFILSFHSQVLSKKFSLKRREKRRKNKRWRMILLRNGEIFTSCLTTQRERTRLVLSNTPYFLCTISLSIHLFFFLSSYSFSLKNKMETNWIFSEPFFSFFSENVTSNGILWGRNTFYPSIHFSLLFIFLSVTFL